VSFSEQELIRTGIRTHKIAAIPGDGIGIEVVAAGFAVLDALAAHDRTFRFEVEHFDWGTDADVDDFRG